MATHIYIAPAAFGKTEYILQHVRAAARGLAAQPIVCVPTPVQARSARRRLAALGGALGVRVLIFDELNRLILQHETMEDDDVPHVELADAVQFRLMRSVLAALAAEQAISHYAPLREMPGFISEARRLVFELKNAGVAPNELLDAWAQAQPTPARLREIGAIYRRWQERLVEGQWADRPGITWLAARALDKGSACLPEEWSPIVFDGFDSLTEVQLWLLQALERRQCGDLLISLTGDPDDRGSEPARPAHRRFHTTRLRLEQALGVRSEPLPALRPVKTWQPALLHLQQTLFEPQATQTESGGAVALIEASNRLLEVRAALRWLKQRMIRDGLSPADCGLVARTVEPYRAYVAQTAAEYGIPVYIEDGLPLDSNPAVAALLLMLRVMLPLPNGDPALPRREVVDLWRSPYFDWRICGVGQGDADNLDTAARAGLVVRGLTQWREALRAMAGRRAATEVMQEMDDAEAVALAPDPGEAARLLDCFETFVARIRPRAQDTFRRYVHWFEELVGAGEEEAAGEAPALAAHDHSLRVLTQATAPAAGATPESAARDRAALDVLKDVLRGLVWAEDALGQRREVPFAEFVSDLAAAIEAHLYVPLPPADKTVFVASTVQARGVLFRALAVLGLAEGEYPARIQEDPFLRDEDRERLRPAFPGVQLSTDSAEREYFLDTVTRPSDALLLVRPRLAENGAEWEPSAFWQEVRRRVKVDPEHVALGRPVPPEQAASLPELIEALSARSWLHAGKAARWLEQTHPAAAARLARAAEIVRARLRREPSPWLGDLSHAPQLLLRFGPAHAWSPTAIETYRACGFLYLIARVLRLEPRLEPEEGLDVAQLGRIYHRILEEVYRSAGPDATLETLLERLPAVAGPILDRAPAGEGFRVTPWWAQQRAEVLQHLQRSLVALDALDGAPLAVEQYFGDDTLLRLAPPQGADGPGFGVHGVVDRIDRLPDGTLRVIDYKTGTQHYDSAAGLARGHRLQIALYALAVEQALNLGTVSDGFYFFAHKGRAASWSLATFGMDEARRAALEHAWDAVQGARRGTFAPTPPEGGCPAWCPATAFCWQYTPGFE